MGKDGKGGARRRQSNPCKIWKQNVSNDRRGTETINERELRKIRGLRWKDHDARINQTIEESYHCLHHRQDDGRRQEEGSEEVRQGRNNKLLRKRRTEDMFMSHMKQDDDKGNSVFRTMMQLNDETAQEALSKMKQAFAENGKKFLMQKLSFEAVERWKYENKSTTQQAVKAQQEKAMQEAERREQEVRRFKEDQKQIMIEKATT